MKCVLAGVNIQDYLSRRTLVAKVGSLVLGVAGGLSIGKEGPYVHTSSCIAHQLLSLPAFQRIGRNEQSRRQVLAAACAAGVSATFGAPVGGVLFSIEVTASFYSIHHLWKAMFTSVCGAAVFRASRVFGSLKLFDLTNFQTQDLGDLLFNGEMYAFAILGVLCGVLGAAFVNAVASLVTLIRQLRTIVAHAPTSLGRPGMTAPADGPAPRGGGVTSGALPTDEGGAALSAWPNLTRTRSSIQGAMAGLGGGLFHDGASYEGGADAGAYGAKFSSGGGHSSMGLVGSGSDGVSTDASILRRVGLRLFRSLRAGDAWARLKARCTWRGLMAAMLSRYGYTLMVAFTSAMLTFPFGFFRAPPEEVVNALFGAAPFELSSRWSQPSLMVNLLIYMVCKFVFTVIAVGCPISCGVFSPVFLFGAAFGRFFGEAFNLLTPGTAST